MSLPIGHYLTQRDPKERKVYVECESGSPIYAIPLSAINEDGSVRALPPGKIFKINGFQPCPWQGTLLVTLNSDEYEWECPLCGVEHTGVIDDFDD